MPKTVKTPTQSYTDWKQTFLDAYGASSLCRDENQEQGLDWDNIQRLNHNIDAIEHDAWHMCAIAMHYGKTDGNDSRMHESSRFLDEALIQSGIYPQFASAFDEVSHQCRLLGVEPYVDICDTKQAVEVALAIVNDCVRRPLKHYTDEPLDDKTDPNRIYRAMMRKRIIEKHKPLDRQSEYREDIRQRAKKKATEKNQK